MNSIYLLPLSQNNSDTSHICLSQNNSDTSQKTLFQSNAMSDFLQNRICCTSQHTEQCFYGHEVDLTLPLASRGPQRLYGVVPAFCPIFSKIEYVVLLSTTNNVFNCYLLNQSLPIKTAQKNRSILWRISPKARAGNLKR